MADKDKKPNKSTLEAHGNGNNNNETAESSVKSVAIVKHQVVRSPANFARLKCNTDLNIPPSNWLNSSINSYGFQQALSQSKGFPSFRLAHLFPDCVGEVDVVANADNIKRLLKLPYAPNSTISMMVHRIENTLLIDEFDVQRFLMQQEDYNWQWLRSFIYNHILTRLNDPDRTALCKQALNDSTHQRSLLSKFLYHSLSRTDELQPQTESETSEQLDLDLLQPQFRLPSIDGPLLPEPNIEENVPDPKHTKHEYNRTVVWTFEDIRMLIGTDMAIFGGASRPCISLRLRDMQQPINVLTGIDYWLDNLMCNVPEVVMCYHLDGLVQKYEIIKTEDLPYMEGSTFSPKAIRNVAQNILSFLKQNATKSGHTYWLFKGRNDDVVKLYDLSSLNSDGSFPNPCTTGESDSESTHATTAHESTSSAHHQSATNKKDEKNPFTVPVAMLLYKVARNMKNSGESIGARKAGSIKALLDNCIKLLPKEQYPQIVTSSYYLLSDLHIPIGIDPMDPKFNQDCGESDSMYDDDNNNSDDTGSINADDENVTQLDEGNLIAVQSVVDATKESNFNQSQSKQNPLPQPLIGSVDERCASALHYIANGLNCLQYFTMTEEKLSKEREEIAKQTEKMQIIQEEQNPNMAKPYQAIPLPYETLNASSIKTGAQQDRNDNKEHGTKEHIKLKHLHKKSIKSNDANIGSSTTATKSLSTKRPLISSWNMHLRLLLLEKACLIYATLTEQAYQREQYGVALRYISLAMKCHHVVIKYMQTLASIRTNYKTNLLARAGDCFFQLSLQYDSIDIYLAQYDIKPDVDVAIEKELKMDLKAIENETKIPDPTNNMEQLLLTSIWCYETALSFVEGNLFGNEIIVRIGSVLNELGVKYMHWSQEEWNKKTTTITSMENNNTGYSTNAIMDDTTDADNVSTVKNPLYLTLAIKSYDCLARGIALFDKIKDNVNLAVLLSNLGRCMRLRAHIVNDEQFNFKKTFYKNAFTSYERALTLLESKKSNPQLWDNVMWDLSTGKFVLGKLMLEQFNETMTEEIEQEIIEHLMQALKYCDIETPGKRQIMYIIRSGLIYHHLGNMYYRAFKQEIDLNARKKKLLQLCRLYFEKSAKIFESIEAPIEFLTVQVDRLNLQNCLFEGSQTPAQKLKSLHMGLSIVCASIDQFRKFENFDENNATILIDQMKQFEMHLQTILKQLIRVTMNKQSDVTLIAEYKRLYIETLQTNAINRDNFVIFTQHLIKILENILQSNIIHS